MVTENDDYRQLLGRHIVVCRPCYLVETRSETPHLVERSRVQPYVIMSAIRTLHFPCLDFS